MATHAPPHLPGNGSWLAWRTQALLLFGGLGSLHSCRCTESRPCVSAERPEDGAGEPAESIERQERLRAIALERKRLTNEAELAEARAQLLASEQSLAEAQAALRVFLEHEYPHKLAQLALELEQAEEELEVAYADWAGIREIYELEEEARSKDEILRRHENSAYFAEEKLKLLMATTRHELHATLPERRAGLERAVHKAELELDQARSALVRSDEEARLALEQLALEQGAEREDSN